MTLVVALAVVVLKNFLVTRAEARESERHPYETPLGGAECESGTVNDQPDGLVLDLELVLHASREPVFQAADRAGRLG